MSVCLKSTIRFFALTFGLFCAGMTVGLASQADQILNGKKTESIAR